MKPHRSYNIRYPLAILSGLLVIGCGLKTPPVPPQLVVPKAIDDLRYALGPQGVTLTWSYPTQNTTGAPLNSVSQFLIFRAVTPMADYCPGCPLSFEPPRTITGGIIPAGSNRKTATYTEPVLRPNHVYSYKVQSRGGWLYSSADSNIVHFNWHSPPAAPPHFTAQPADNAVILTWEAPKTFLDGSPVTVALQYQLYRATNSNATLRPLTEPITATTYTDPAVISGTTYVYQVAALHTVADTTISGRRSPVVTVRPKGPAPLPPKPTP